MKGGAEYAALVRETLVLDLNAEEQVSGSGASYRATSDQNPDIAKAQITVPVTDY